MNTLVGTENYTHSFSESAQPIWYAVQTRSRHEKFVNHHLQMRGMSSYLPTITKTHLWSDRRKKVELPLFPGYLFIQLIPCNEWRVKVLRTPGVVRFVGCAPVGENHRRPKYDLCIAPISGGRAARQSSRRCAGRRGGYFSPTKQRRCLGDFGGRNPPIPGGQHSGIRHRALLILYGFGSNSSSNDWVG